MSRLRLEFRMWRLGIVALGFSTALGLGLAGGMNLHRLVDPDQAPTWLPQTGSTLQSAFEAARHGIGSRIASFASSPTSVSETTERVARQEPNSGEAVARMVGDLNHVYFEKRSFSSSGSRRSLTQRRSAMMKGSRFRRASKSATRRVRSSALAWQW